MSRRRALWLTAGAAVLTTAIAPTLVPNARGQQISPVPSTRVFHVRGHGWGHGHGLSQDGANGAASVKHLSASQIVSFYYPHTAAGTISNPNIRILLQGTASNYVDLAEPPGTGTYLAFHDLASNYAGNLPGNVARWRFIVGAPNITIQQLLNNTWTPYAPGGHASFAGPINISAQKTTSSAAIRVIYPSGTERDYRGIFQVYPAGTNNVDALAVMPMESYLYGVVPRESPSSWPAAALQAQAIAARSYAEYEREHVGSGHYDICDSTSCQVFGGTTEVTSSGTTQLEASSSTAAVNATVNQIRTYGGKAIFAQYSADDGGWTTDGGAPYLIAQADPYDSLGGSSSYEWSASLPASVLESAYPSIGTLRRIRVTQRDGHGEWGGRVLQAVLEGSNGSVTVSGSAVSSAYSWPTHSTGLRGSWWELVPTPPADFLGSGTSDVSVWRGSQGNWYVYGKPAVHYGTAGDIPVPGDYDGDGTTERAVFRPSNGYWYVEGKASVQWGTNGDVPVPADYNGDGRTDLAVYRPSTGHWYVRSIESVTYGSRTDVPVPGDYDGDGSANLAVWRPSTGQWLVYGVSGAVDSWGVAGDIPVPGDYRGLGATEHAIFRPSNGRWYVHDGRASAQYGTKGDVPVPGDYDGDGITQAAVYRPWTGAWYRSGLPTVKYGVSTDEPAPLPYAIYRAR